MQPSEPVVSDQPLTRRTAAEVIKDILLLFAGPFITIAYLPVFGVLAVLMLTRRGRHIWRQCMAPD